MPRPMQMRQQRVGARFNVRLQQAGDACGFQLRLSGVGLHPSLQVCRRGFRATQQAGDQRWVALLQLLLHAHHSRSHVHGLGSLHLVVNKQLAHGELIVGVMESVGCLCRHGVGQCAQVKLSAVVWL
jgi:hypothetical protein